jgi:ABC-type uncharacterized transport system permease subunit
LVLTAKSLAELDSCSDGMIAGRGFMALATVIFGRPGPSELLQARSLRSRRG